MLLFTFSRLFITDHDQGASWPASVIKATRATIAARDISPAAEFLMAVFTDGSVISRLITSDAELRQLARLFI